MKRYKIIILLLIIILSVVVIKPLFQSKALTVAYYEKYTVQANDTLWGIAKQYNHGKDIRRFIYIIEDNNKITANLTIGSEILIPIIEQ